MKERILVGEFNLSARGNYQQRGLEALIFLNELRDLRSLLNRRRDRRCISYRREPDDELRSVFYAVSASCQLDLASEFDSLRPSAKAGQQQEAQDSATWTEAGHQKRIPIERLIWLVTLLLS